MNESIGEGRSGEPQQTDIRNRNETTNLTELIGSDKWQHLTPNYPSPTALLPKELHVEQIEQLVNSIANPTTMKTLREGDIEQEAKKARDRIEIPGIGVLEKLIPGEAGIPYVLTVDSGKKLMLKLEYYSPSLGVQSPEDPKMYKRANEGGGEVLWQYSDLRTYLMIPVEGTKYAVKFQEYGGENNTKDHFRYGKSLLALPRISHTRKRAKQDIRSRGFDPSHRITQGELNKPKHYLFNRGVDHAPAVIDIPVVFRR